MRKMDLSHLLLIARNGQTLERSRAGACAGPLSKPMWIPISQHAATLQHISLLALKDVHESAGR